MPSKEFAEFTRMTEKVLAVSRSELMRREAEYQRGAKLRPRRGPKRKATKTA